MNRAARGLAALGWACAACAAAAPPTGTTLLLPVSVRQAACGDVSLLAPDIQGAWSNPALLGGQDPAFSAVVTGASLFGGIGSIVGAAVGRRLGPGLAAGVLASMYATSVAELDDGGAPTGLNVDHRVMSVAAIGAGRAGPVWLGGSAKAVSEELDRGHAAAVAVDLGLMIRGGPFTAGGAARNLGPTPAGSLDAALPFELRAGVTAAVPGIPALTAGFEATRLRAGAGRAGLGFEWWPGARLGLRAGLARNGSWDTLGVRAGLAYAGDVLGFDYALWTHPLGTTHVVGLSYRTPRVAAPSRTALGPARPAARTSSDAVVLTIKPLATAGPPRAWKIEIRDRNDRIVRTYVGSATVMPRALEWDGWDERGKPVVDLTMVRIRVSALDAGGLSSESDHAAPVVGVSPRLLSADEDRAIPDVDFFLPEGAFRRWRVEVRDGADPVWCEDGAGTPPPAVRWMGRDGAGRVRALAEPRYAWSLEDEDGNASTGAGAIATVVVEPESAANGDWLRLPELEYDGDTGDLETMHAVRMSEIARLLARFPDSPVEIESVARPASDGDDVAARARTRAEHILRVLINEFGVRTGRVIMRCRAMTVADDCERIRVAIQPRLNAPGSSGR